MTPWHLANWRRFSCVLAGAMLALAAGGCASFWDEVLSRERDLGAYFSPPDPLIVIRETTDGERRARALASLKEPSQHGGSVADQEAYVKILSTAASSDRDPFCRLAALQALGHFKDPRAAQTLESVYKQTKLPYTQDFNSLIRQTALTALEKAGNDESRQFFILVARQPGPAADASSADRRQTQDEKLIAIRALGKYRQSECIETLVYILETEKDAGLRDSANQSLRTATGKSLPPDAQVWRAEIAGLPTGVHEPNIIERVTGWWKQ